MYVKCFRVNQNQLTGFLPEHLSKKPTTSSWHNIHNLSNALSLGGHPKVSSFVQEDMCMLGGGIQGLLHSFF